MNLAQRAHHDRLLNRARRQATTGRRAEAMRLVRLVLKRQPAHIGARLLAARLLIDGNFPQLAIDELDAASWYMQAEDPAVQRPSRTDHLVLRAKALCQLGLTDKAADVLHRVLRRRPNHRKALCLLADLHAERGDVEPAIALMQAAIRHGKPRRASFGRLVELYEAAGRYEDALATLDQLESVTGVPEPSDAMLRARLLRAAGRDADATDAYERMTERHATDKTAHHEAADLAATLGDEPRAARHLRAVVTTPAPDEALVMRAELHMRAGRFDRAGRLYWRVAQRRRTHAAAEAHLLVCAILEHRHRLAERVHANLKNHVGADEARRHTARAWQLATPGRLIPQAYGLAERETTHRVLPGLLRESAGVFESALAENPGYADLHYHLANCHVHDDRRDSAAESLHQALRINAGYLDAARLRVRMLIDDGNLDAAAALLRSTRQRKPDTTRLLDLELALDVLQGNNDGAHDRLNASQLPDHTRRGVMMQVATTLRRLGHPDAEEWQPITDAAPIAA